MTDRRSTSRIPGFRSLSAAERAAALLEYGFATEADADLLKRDAHTLDRAAADRMIENVVGVLGLPVGIALNFLINGRDYVLPLAVEEPSIVAALSSAAKVARLSGGFTASATDPILIGQVQIVDVDDPLVAEQALYEHRDQILNLANSLHPKMLARGGGARDIEVHRHVAPTDGRDMVVLHLLVDTRDAMGANLVNTMCEGVASLCEGLTGGKVFLRILSNLSDRSLARAEMRIPLANLAGKGYTGEEVRDGIILASDFAAVDPYRATTHNKGVMNGVDALAVATGNDWRAIEAAAHAYAARNGRYTSLTQWFSGADGELVGRIEIPMKVGTVGGPLQSNPTVAINHRMLGVSGAVELAGIMACVGLGQNFSALRALATEGIQQGHMTLHARTVANAAGTPPELFDAVVEQLIEDGQIKVWKAQEILASLQRTSQPSPVAEAPRAAGYGKVILLGEHAVVYGRHALAAPLPLAVEARVEDAIDGIEVVIPRWGLEQRVRKGDDGPHGLGGMLTDLLSTLGLLDRSMRIEVFPHVPRAMGLGASSALAVAIVRALDAHYELGLADEEVNRLAFECERATHGTPSGIDNTVATYGQFLSYRRQGDDIRMETVIPARPIPLVVGISGRESLTARTVATVREAWQAHPQRYERMFDQIDELTGEGLTAVREGDLATLGELCNLCHGILNGLQLSTPELEDMVRLARDNGALGAKLTGGGGGGSMLAVCPDDDAGAVRTAVRAALEGAGYQAMEVTLG